MKSIAHYCGLGAVAAALTLATACSGSTGSFSPAGSGITSNAQAGQGMIRNPRALPSLVERRKHGGAARVTIRIPRKTWQIVPLPINAAGTSARRIRPKYISASTESMTIAVAGVPTQTFNLTPGSPGCFSNETSTTCSETAFFPTGRQTIAIALYDQTKGTGNILSQASDSVDVAAGAITNVAIVLNGVPATATAFVNGSPNDAIPEGKPTSVPVTVLAYDADHNIIMSPGNYTSPIKVSDSDTSGATKLATASIKKPGETVLLKYDGSATVSAVTITPSVDGTVQSSGTATVVMASNATPPTITEYDIPTAYSEPIGITNGPDGALWFVENGAEKIGRTTTLGTTTEYALPNNVSQNARRPSGITTGPDGALWFTETCINQIGRITTQGTITEYSLPKINDIGSYPYDITAGPDGALWFTENAGNEIGRMTTLGAVTEYSIPTSASYPSGITTGPDGALWFTECKGAGKIGRITTSGTITEYSTPTYGSGPSGIAVGPDGALWFTEYCVGKIGRITTTGAISEYVVSVPASSYSFPNNIALGPDGAMWFTDGYQNSVGRITVTGANTEYAAKTSNSEPTGITAGPNGTLWFTEYCVSQIGKISFTASSSVHRGTVPRLSTISTGPMSTPTLLPQTLTR